MSRPPRGASEMLAYVDDCLTLEDRRALESRMAREPETRRQIDRWLLQNEAIRAAFGDSSPVARSFAGERASAVVRTLREYDGPERRRPRGDPAASPPGDSEAPPAPALEPTRKKANGARLARRIFFTLVAVLAVWTAGAIGFSGERTGRAVEAATAAYRTFAQSGTRPVEIATSDRAALDKWFAAQIGRAAPVPDLTGSGQRLLGGRIVPGAVSAAQFVLYENGRRERVGLEIEALDAPAATDVEIYGRGDVIGASWTGAGYRFAMIGPASGAPIAELARLAREAQPGN